MSGTCRDTYCNYGSYLRSRGIDKAVCELNSKIIANTAAISANTAAIAINTLDISANTVAITNISNIISNYDISFTTIDLNVTNIDVSNNVNFTKNPIVTNDASYNNRVLRNYSESTSVLDISASGQYSDTLHDLSLNIPALYSDLDPNVLTGTNPIFTNDFIDFSNNQGYFRDSLMEVYVSATVSFDQPQTKSVSFVFDNVAGTTEILLDTRSINQTNIPKTLCFGPQMFVFNDSSPESSFIEDQWRVGIDICGGDVTFLENPRMVIKQKSLV
jgi:hypothetical protein